MPERRLKMMSGAESTLAGTGAGAEEARGGAAGEGVQGTDGAGDVGSAGVDGSGNEGGDEGERWEDLNPDAYHPTLRNEVVRLNKAAKSQFHRTVQRLSEGGKLTQKQLKELSEKSTGFEQMLRAFADDPAQFEAWHRKHFPNHQRWKQGNQQDGRGQISEDDAQALQVLRKAGIITKDDLAQLIGPLVNTVKTAEAREMQKLERESEAELDSVQKWCAENKYPWNDTLARSCINLIAQGAAKDMKSAYEMLAKPLIDAHAQAELARKKGGQTGKTSEAGDKAIANESLRDTITRFVKQRSKA